MKTYKILHIMHNEKFILSFIQFINNNLRLEEHQFLILGGAAQESYSIPNYKNVKILNVDLSNKKNYVNLENELIPYFNKANKIILHGLFQKYYIDFLFKNSSFLNKCIWIMWGGDLYDYQKRGLISRSFFTLYKKKSIIKKLGGFMGFIKGDYELVKKWHGTKGKYYESFVYPSNLYKEYEIKKKTELYVNIQLGNSADPTNNHIEILEQLKKYKDENIKIFVPLSYGGQKYKEKVMEKGKELFGDKFIALVEFMHFDKYLEFLSNIDIAIFSPKRQQAMGNMITLLGLGKKVYIRNDITPWQFFKDKDIKVFDISTIDLKLMEKKEASNNQQNIKNYFSEEKLKKQLKEIFKDES